MLKYKFLLLALLFFGVGMVAQKNWKPIDRLPEDARLLRNVVYMPTSFSAMELDYDNFINELSNAPLEFTASRENKYIQLPLPSGELVNLRLVSSPVMESELAAKYPSIQSFKVYSDDKNYFGRFDISPYGLRAVLTTPEGDMYIDPYLKEEKTVYISYYLKNGTEPRDIAPACGVNHAEYKALESQSTNKSRFENVNLHKYRLALACTGEWGKVRGTVEKALADMNTSVNRLNQIYEKEFATRLVIINENDKLIHLDPATDPYLKPTSGRETMGQNTDVINSILVNSGKYDLGHVYTNTCSDVGGVAMLGSLCQLNKGNGCSCFYDNLIYITVEVTAHEMGHQFSANHTFNNCNADAARPPSNGYEPGGGSTIMSYAQLCGPNSFTSASEDYYHQASLLEIYNHLRGDNTCAEKVPIANTAPTVKIKTPQNIVIPIGTYFVLDAEGFDADGDKLRYGFEQKNSDANECPLGQPTGVCPLFRSYRPDTLPYRVFPNKSRILAGQNSSDEILPFYSRTLDFAVTVRDQNPLGGVAAWEEVQIKADESAGPFKVIFPNNGEAQEAGTVLPISWDVAKTDKAPINCKYVDIYISRKSAVHVSDKNLLLLAGRVPNTGSANVQIPGTLGNDARILIKSSDNIFFDLSNFRFSVTKSSKPRAFVSVDKYYENICSPNKASIKINSEAIEGYNGVLSYGVGTLPTGLTAKFANNSANVGIENTLDLNAATELPTGTYVIDYFIATEANDTLRKKMEINVISTDFSSLATLLPLNGERDAELPTFTWNGSSNALSYQIEVSKDPTFATVEFSKNVTEPTYKHFKTFDKKSVFFWRVKAINSCKEGDWSDAKSFGTLTQDCKVYSAIGLPSNISASGTPKIESKINVPTGSNISDVNITKLKINHTNFKDLTGTLVDPSGKRVILWNAQCPKSLNIEILIDDQAPNPFSCSNTASGQYKPEEKLSAFNGLNATGAWTLEIKDNASGSGGKLEAFDLEICASVSVENPTLVNYNPLSIIPTDIGSITSNLLLAEDKNNTASELTFTVVKPTQKGEIRLNGNALSLGSTFTQDDINSNKVTYAYKGTGNLPTNDAFNFIVKDTEGGWAGINTFNIEIKETVATSDVLDPSLISVYPNPSNGIFNVSLNGNSANFNKVKVYNALGKLVNYQQVIGKNTVIDLNAQATGVYVMEFTNGIERVIKRVVLTK
jgi:subtilisin-like proprotein convertase family protein